MNGERLSEILSQFPSRRVAVVGDFFLDKYLEVDPDLAEISLETGKVANQVVEIRHSPGAAGNVVANMVSLGAREVMTIGFTGDDGEGYELRKDLTAFGCNTDHLLYSPESYTPTYLKPRNMRLAGLEGEHERYDTKNRTPLLKNIESKLMDSLREVVPTLDAIVIVDQADEENCGVVTDAVRALLCELGAQHPRIVFWADSRHRLSRFRSVTLKPNQSEAVRAAFPGYDGPIDDQIVMDAGRSLRETTGRDVFVTRSENGILVFSDDNVTPVRGLTVAGPIDPTGAGDSVTASAVLSLASGASPTEAALIANLVGSITVRQLGVCGVAKPEELAPCLEVWQEQGG